MNIYANIFINILKEMESKQKSFYLLNIMTSSLFSTFSVFLHVILCIFAPLNFS